MSRITCSTCSGCISDVWLFISGFPPHNAWGEHTLPAARGKSFSHGAKPGLTQRRKGTRRNAEKNRSATLCPASRKHEPTCWSKWRGHLGSQLKHTEGGEHFFLDRKSTRLN